MPLTVFEIATLLSKWAIYLSFAAVIGGTFMLNLLRRQPDETATIRFYIGGGAVLGLLAVSINYLVQVGSFAESGFAGMFDKQMHAFLWSSSVGESVVWRMAGFGLVFVASWIVLSSALKARRIAWGLLLVGAILLAVAFGTTGHSTELDLFSRGMVFLHVLAIGSWVGAFYPLWRLCSSTDVAVLQRLMVRFGQLGIGIVSLVALSGGILLWQLFDKPDEFITSPYGIAMLVKLSLVIVILLIAARHKFILVPQLANNHAHSVQHRLKNSIASEVLVALFILATTAVLSSVLGPVSLA